MVSLRNKPTSILSLSIVTISGVSVGGFLNLKPMQNQNDLFKLRRILDMFEAMLKIEFETESGQEFKNTLNASVSEIIKPEMVKLGNQLKKEIIV